MLKKHIVLGILLLTAGCRPAPDRFELKVFKDPPATYRSMSFWSLNDSLHADEMKRQLALFKEGGMGGSFLHSRPGLLTPYLGDEWFDMMEVGVKESQSLGLETWFYDEDKWPSGFAGGIVPKQSDDFRARTLVRVPSGTKVEAPDELLLDDGVHAFISHVDPWGQPWYNGTCWVDLMNPETVKAFLDCTYEPYVKRFAGKKGVMGIFSDEPQVSPRKDLACGDAFIPYSPVMQKAFRQRWGYEMIPHLASLVDTVGNWRQFRLHYYRTVGACFENAFSKQIGDYCAANGLKWTGHFNREEEPYANVMNEGDLMTQYRHMQVPGIDALGLRFKVLHNGKVMTSVANQYGKRRRVVEIFGIAGHNLSLEDRMWLTAWHTNCGLNILCPHLSHYTLKGIRKYDYPPSFNYQEPWWQDNRLFEDYAARLCYFATVGATEGEVCVLTTLESDYIDLDVRNESVPARDVMLEDILQRLNGLHYNTDLGNEQIISEIGAVDGSRLRIGQMSYHTVILPDLLTLRPSTLALLEEFASNGGNVLVCGGWPRYMDGENCGFERLHELGASVAPEELGAWLNSHCDRQFVLEGEDAPQIWTHLRKVKGGHTLQLSNISRTKTVRVKLCIPSANRKLALLNPLDGSMLALPVEDGCAELEFAPAQTWVLAYGEKPVRGKTEGVYSIPAKEEEFLTLEGPWTARRLDPNALVMDFAEWSADGGNNWNSPEPVLAMYDRFNSRAATYNGPMLLRFGFEVDAVPQNCFLVVEQPWMYKDISLNGSSLSFGKDYYVDTYFRKADATALVHEGHNEVLLSLDFKNPIPDSYNALERYGTEIENIFLCGDFAVSGKLAAEQPVESWRNRNPMLNPKPLPARFECGSFRIIAEKEVPGMNFTMEGYPFYSGSIECSTSFVLDTLPEGRLKLAFPAVEAITVGVNVNGKELPKVFCSPWEADITDALKTGENNVTLTLTGSLRNLMGPSHCIGGEFSMLGPATFSGRDSWPNFEQGDNDWFEKRKTGSTRLWRDDYFCIPFGLQKKPLITESVN